MFFTRLVFCVFLFSTLDFTFSFSNVKTFTDYWKNKITLNSFYDKSDIDIANLLYLFSNDFSNSYFYSFFDDRISFKNKFYWKIKYFNLISQVDSNYFTTRSSNDEYQVPEDFNLVVVVRDIVSSNDDSDSYAEIFINRRSFGRTSEGLKSQKKLIKLNVKSGVRHMLQVRKFELDLNRNQWLQVRNIEQPKIKYFIIPDNRIRVIEILYNSYNENPQNEDIKYKYRTFFLRKGQNI